MKEFLLKSGKLFGALFVMVWCGLFFAAFHFVALIQITPEIDFLASAVVIYFFYRYLSDNRGNHQAKHCTVSFFLMYTGMAIRDFQRELSWAFYIVGALIFFMVWTEWEKQKNTDTIGCYSRWMTTNIIMLTYVITFGIIFHFGFTPMLELVFPLALLWLVMIVKLSWRLR